MHRRRGGAWWNPASDIVEEPPMNDRKPTE
jgi:hypothetical protein